MDRRSAFLGPCRSSASFCAADLVKEFQGRRSTAVPAGPGACGSVHARWGRQAIRATEKQDVQEEGIVHVAPHGGAGSYRWLVRMPKPARVARGRLMMTVGWKSVIADHVPLLPLRRLKGRVMATRPHAAQLSYEKTERAHSAMVAPPIVVVSRAFAGD